MALIPCPGCAKESSPDAEACPHCGYPVAKRRRQARRGTGCLVLFGVVVGGCVLLSIFEPSRERPSPAFPVSISLSETVGIRHDHWSISQAGRAEHTLTITNRSPLRLKDLTLNFHYYSKTRAHLGTKSETIYEFFERSRPHTVTISHFIPDQTANASVSLISAVTDGGDTIIGD